MIKRLTAPASASTWCRVVPGIAILRPRMVWLRVSVNINQTSPSPG